MRRWVVALLRRVLLRWVLLRGSTRSWRISRVLRSSSTIRRGTTHRRSTWLRVPRSRRHSWSRCIAHGLTRWLLRIGWLLVASRVGWRLSRHGSWSRRVLSWLLGRVPRRLLRVGLRWILCSYLPRDLTPLLLSLSHVSRLLARHPSSKLLLRRHAHSWHSWLLAWSSSHLSNHPREVLPHLTGGRDAPLSSNFGLSLGHCVFCEIQFDFNIASTLALLVHQIDFSNVFASITRKQGRNLKVTFSDEIIL
mmetsp:Transcript_15939/g.24645  ORF Transcript_15939/g.24645 Transcript_15939/m.24645 type:complete len:250 (-) Transcript_15939:272-1021(-)